MMEPTNVRINAPERNGQSINTTTAIPLMPLTTATTSRFVGLGAGETSISWVLCVKGKAGRSAAPHLAQKMSPASTRLPHWGQVLSAATFGVASSIKAVSYAVAVTVETRPSRNLAPSVRRQPGSMSETDMLRQLTVSPCF